VRNRAFIVAVTLLLAGANGARADAGRRLYKWVDEQGVTHYGDRIPPEYAAQEQHVFNGQGVEIERRDAQKSAAQLAAEDQQRQAVEQMQNRDRNLLNTYGSLPEIEQLRDQRLALLDVQMKVTNQFLDRLNQQLHTIETTVTKFRPYSENPHAPPMPDQVAEDLVRIHNDIRTQEHNLLEKRREEDAMRAQFDSDIRRFRELKGLH
jgi:hypothetical protein